MTDQNARPRLSARCRCGSRLPRNGRCSPGSRRPARSTMPAWARPADVRGWSASPKPTSTPGPCPATIPRGRPAFARRAPRAAFPNMCCTPTPSSSASPGWGSIWIAWSSRPWPAAPTAPPIGYSLGKLAGSGAWGRHQLDTVEGKTNTSGLRWCGDRLEWKGLVLPARLDPQDRVQTHGLACPVKYVRLVRRKLGERNRFYAQLVCQGTPYQKPQYRLGTGIVGLDLGPSSIAVVSEQAARLQPFCPEVAPDARALRRLDRKLDRQRRANNPAHYDERGRVKRGAKRWKTSKRQRRVQARRRELYRKLAATRKRSHGQLAHRVLALGSIFQLEQLSYRAGQRTYGKSVQLCAPGMNVLRLSRLAASAGGTIVLINAWRARLSQTCHCGRIKKKSRSQRWHGCPCGASSQRDLFSAYLARFVHPDTSLLDAGQAQAAWPGWEPTLQAAYERAIANQPARGRRLPVAFGRPPADQSQSGSLAEGPPVDSLER